MIDSSPNNGDLDLGVQPLDVVLDELELSNHELVSASTEQLTHKQVQKARRGRRVTKNIQKKILHALNRAMEQRDEERRFALRELFNYHP
ncbi:MAG: hypothetical protein AAF357_06105 [Verrucomicrobiota bacterium]